MRESLLGSLGVTRRGGTPAIHAYASVTFPEPGLWTCVSRGVVEGVDERFESTFFATPWSAPMRFEVLSDFRRVQARIVRPRGARAAEFGAASAGGRAKLKLLRFVRCRGSGYRFKTAGTCQASFDARAHARFRIRRPRARPGFCAATVSFADTHFVRAGADARLIMLPARRKRIELVGALSFPQC